MRIINRVDIRRNVSTQLRVMDMSGYVGCKTNTSSVLSARVFTRRTSGTPRTDRGRES